MKELILVILVLDIIAEIFLIRRLEKERDNAEDRAVTHFKRAQKFETQLKEMKKEYEEQTEILLNNSAELRSKIVDLENNVEFLVNQLPKQKRELVRPGNQN